MRYSDIKNRIKEISDLDLQRKLWLNKNNDTGLIFSYTELMNSLFDDLMFDDFVDNTIIRENWNLAFVEKMNQLRSYLNDYQEKQNDEEIIKDPEWIKISQFAKEILDILNIQTKQETSRSNA